MKKSLVAAIVAVVGFAAVVAEAEETTKVRTSVSLHTHRYGEARFLSGDVKAKKGCQKRRSVVLRSKYEEGNFGRDKSNARGRFRIDRFGHGSSSALFRVFAVAKRKRITNSNGDEIVCKGGRSDGVRVARHPYVYFTR